MGKIGSLIGEVWRSLGPGLVTGAADDDPSGIATYSQTGAQFGFQYLWTSLFTYPFMSVIQEMCARIGIVTGRGLAQNMRLAFPRSVLYVCTGLLVAANTFNISADINAMAHSVDLIVPVDYVFVVTIFVFVSVVAEVFISYRTYARYLKYLTIVVFGYIVTAFFVHIDWMDALRHTVIPSMSFSRDTIVIVTAILGTTISPYLFFWQTAQEVEEEILEGRHTVEQRRGAAPGEIRRMRFDVWSGMFVSNIVMFFIIVVCGATLYVSGITDIQTAAQAAEALRPFAGSFATTLFALGIIGTGFLAIPVLAASSAYAVAETFHWHEGLYRTWRKAYGFYAVILFSFVIALALALSNIDPIKALIYSAVLNAFASPLILAFIVILSGDRRIMGSHANGPITKVFGWTITGLMAAACIATIFSFFG